MVASRLWTRPASCTWRGIPWSNTTVVTSSLYLPSSHRVISTGPVVHILSKKKSRYRWVVPVLFLFAFESYGVWKTWSTTQSFDVKKRANQDNVVRIEEQDKDAVFIPTTLPVQLPIISYRSQDPEWKAFKSFYEDREHQTRARKMLAELVVKEVATSGYIKMLGDGAMTSASGIFVDFPRIKRVEYARQGLYYDKGSLEWKTQIIPHSHYHTLRFHLRCLPTLDALWKVGKMEFTMKVAAIKTKFGWTLSREQGHAQDLSQSLSERAKRLQVADSKARPDVESPNKGNDIKNRLVTSLKWTRHLTPLMASVLRRIWYEQRQPMMRKGCVTMDGSVMVYGHGCNLQVHVTALYDPLTKRIVLYRWRPKKIYQDRGGLRGGPLV